MYRSLTQVPNTSRHAYLGNESPEQCGRDLKTKEKWDWGGEGGLGWSAISFWVSFIDFHWMTSGFFEPPCFRETFYSAIKCLIYNMREGPFNTVARGKGGLGWFVIGFWVRFHWLPLGGGCQIWILTPSRYTECSSNMHIMATRA